MRLWAALLMASPCLTSFGNGRHHARRHGMSQASMPKTSVLDQRRVDLLKTGLRVVRAQELRVDPRLGFKLMSKSRRRRRLRASPKRFGLRRQMLSRVRAIRPRPQWRQCSTNSGVMTSWSRQKRCRNVQRRGAQHCRATACRRRLAPHGHRQLEEGRRLHAASRLQSVGQRHPRSVAQSRLVGQGHGAARRLMLATSKSALHLQAGAMSANAASRRRHRMMLLGGGPRRQRGRRKPVLRDPHRHCSQPLLAGGPAGAQRLVWAPKPSRRRLRARTRRLLRPTWSSAASSLLFALGPLLRAACAR